MVFYVGLVGFGGEGEAVVFEMQGDSIEVGDDDSDGEGLVAQNFLGLLRMLEQFIQSGKNGL